MKKLLRITIRILAILLLVLSNMVWITSPVLAITNPNDIDFGSDTEYYKAFENVLEDNDMLFVAEGYVYYAVPPTDYDAEEAFLFELLDTTGTSIYASTPLNNYGDRPISIYLSATRVTTLGLSSGTAYKLRIRGNPLIFASSTGNTVTATLDSSDYIDQSGATDDLNPLRDGMISMAETIEEYDSPPAGSEYIVEIQGVRYLTLTGGNIFLTGIPALDAMCPVLFQSGIEEMQSEAPESTGTYALTLTPAQKWGNTVANGLTMLGTYLGINQALAGSVVLFIFVIMFAVFVYQKTESGVTVLLMVSATPFLGAYLGLMPMALAFIFVIIIIVLLGYFFFSRGAL